VLSVIVASTLVNQELLVAGPSTTSSKLSKAGNTLGGINRWLNKLKDRLSSLTLGY
jgi:hypothetical protein